MSEDRCQEDQDGEYKKALHSENCKSKNRKLQCSVKQVYLKSQSFIVFNLSELIQIKKV